MIVKYRSFTNQWGGLTYRPLINVKLKFRFRSFSTWGLLDTGADRTLLNKQLIKQLGIDINSCNLGSTQGISGVDQKTWDTTIQLEVVNLSDSLFDSEVSFIDSKVVGILLGHAGFFEYFDVKFSTKQRSFEIEVAK